MDLQIELHSPKSNNSKSSELSDWTSISHEELEITLPAIEKTRARNEVKALHLKHKPLIKKIATKIINIVKGTIKEINHESVHFVIVMVMGEIQKVGLKNYEKKELAKLIIVYILDTYAFSPHIVNYYTIEIIDTMIEFVYHHGLHSIKKKNKSCCCF